MKWIELDCDHCGASLEVPSMLRSVTCAVCNSKLAIKHEGSAIYTEAVEGIAAGPETLEQRAERRRAFERCFTGGALVMIAAGNGALIWGLIASSMGASAFFSMFGVMLGVVGMVIGWIMMSRAQRLGAVRSGPS